MRISFEVFDVECAKRGATDETSRGRLVDIDRTTLWRWRTGRQDPSLEAVIRIATTLEVAVEKLLGREIA